ncbi:hypothetical protein QQ045_025291 [Rhodiola kirilowii]
MSRPHNMILLTISTIMIFALPASHADVGSASHYNPPYLPTACYGTDPKQFPGGSMFGAAGEGIWDNGAACGREYLVRCLSSAEHKMCVPGKTIRIKIVDSAASAVSRPSKDGTTLVLSAKAFGVIASKEASFVTVEYQH